MCPGVCGKCVEHGAMDHGVEEVESIVAQEVPIRQSGPIVRHLHKSLPMAAMRVSTWNLPLLVARVVEQGHKPGRPVNV